MSYHDHTLLLLLPPWTIEIYNRRGYCTHQYISAVVQPIDFLLADIEGDGGEDGKL
jgi:hypothetical protein